MNRNLILPALLLSAAGASWLLGSKTGRTISLILLAYWFLVWGIRALAGKVEAVRRRREPAGMPVYSLREGTFTMACRDRPVQEKALDDLLRAAIMTTDLGPFVCDTFLLLQFRDGTEWRPERDNPSYKSLYEALDNALPLNAEQALMAAFSTDNAVFLLWERDIGE